MVEYEYTERLKKFLSLIESESLIYHPNAVDYDPVYLEKLVTPLSIAISTKRIADTLEQIVVLLQRKS